MNNSSPDALSPIRPWIESGEDRYIQEGEYRPVLEKIRLESGGDPEIMKQKIDAYVAAIQARLSELTNEDPEYAAKYQGLITVLQEMRPK